MSAPALAPAELEAADDLALDHALFRLFALHLNAEAEERVELHACILAVIGEQRVRLDRWLVEHGSASLR